jgi:HEXXH motif-containing protein
MDTVPQAGEERFNEAGVRRILCSVRHFIHHPDVRDFTLVLPARLFSSGPLYLPHVHALLYNESPRTTLAIVEDGGCTRFVWSDGPSLTLGNDGYGLPGGFDHPRLEALPIIGGLPVLNGVSDIAPLLSGFGPAMDEAVRTSSGRVESALALLGEIWPLALHALHRHVKALCILEQRGYSRSHSPPEMPGVIFMSADDVEHIGDLLCHESSHVRMNIFRRYDAIARARDAGMEAAGFVSPWRADRRPLRGLVDGVHAFLNVCRYHRRLAGCHADSWPSRVIYERQRRNVRQAWSTLREHALPTRVGALLFEEFALEEPLL